MVKQCSVCNKTFSVFKSLVETNDQLTCEECAQNKIKKDEHDRRLERSRQKEEIRAAEHRRQMEADQQRHRQELEKSEHQKMLEMKERAQAENNNAYLEMDKRRQDETERGFQRKHELQMAEVKMKGETAEAEARKAEAKAKEANSMARAAEANAKSAEAEAKTAEVNLKIAKAKAKEKEMEHRSMLWKKYLDPETNVQDKELVMDEIRRLSISDDQHVKKVPIVVKEIKAPKSKGEIRSRRPWTTSGLPKPNQ